ncbi:hypothetical protein LX15_003399 [Streptoalloteichus tenebrarius]|uniref:PE domain-containing protein n=1 Tax=Streptoalloteichus tenebrarius (strain ATCC 17920 / DSM 40477 / JCM 4838 / CBS 697.72 / NBRC 16177 / NCIMB 11028 / NRRL B-12390 / A12253. 1 / ISP 5477) TaxID=1933 RepID=A0ABT1HVZ4_STRSD|nr:hypothetical protein [Streptoalloteichus tenebrarius]MCP2259693.1 hypothetical protein [Streptoalloteichus tenebrarius]BFF00670.1 hypothetical protein GCM10020241_23450 [Streptoalloteichus tenebrarius]
MSEGSKLVVNKENVLQAAAAFQAEADRMADVVDLHAGKMRFDAVFGDPASADMSSALAARLQNDQDSHVSRARQYVAELRSAASQLQKVAKDYGYTDEQIAEALSKGAESV